MRLDKYLKLARLVKRRTVAQEMIEVGAVRISGRSAKSASDVAEGNIIEIAYPKRIVKVKVITADESALKKKAVPYELLEETRVEPDERPW